MTGTNDGRDEVSSRFERAPTTEPGARSSSVSSPREAVARSSSRSTRRWRRTTALGWRARRPAASGRDRTSSTDGSRRRRSAPGTFAIAALYTLGDGGDSRAPIADALVPTIGASGRPTASGAVDLDRSASADGQHQAEAHRDEESDRGPLGSDALEEADLPEGRADAGEKDRVADQEPARELHGHTPTRGGEARAAPPPRSRQIQQGRQIRGDESLHEVGSFVDP